MILYPKGYLFPEPVLPKEMTSEEKETIKAKIDEKVTEPILMEDLIAGIQKFFAKTNKYYTNDVIRLFIMELVENGDLLTAKPE